MAGDLSLLFHLKASNEASPAIHSVQGDVAKLRQTFGSEFGAMQQVATTAVSKVTQSLTNFSGQIPVIGGAVQGLSTQLSSMASATEGAGAELAAVAGPIGIAVVAIGALAAGAAIAAKELVDLAVATAEWEDRLDDLSQQTGVSVETLNALDLLFSKTGGDLSAASASLGIFQKNLDEAQDSGSKAAKTFKNLGVETFNTEDALRQTLLALAKLPEGYRQTALALELFGRGGKAFLAALKESNGDIDQVIPKLGELARVTKEQTKLANDYDNAWKEVQLQLRGLSAVIGREFIPVLLSALKELQQALKDNKLLIQDLGIAAKLFAGIIGGDVKIALYVLNASLTLLQANLKAVTPYIELIQSLIDLIKESNNQSLKQNIPAVKIPTPLDLSASVAATLPSAKTAKAARVTTPGKSEAEKEEERRLARQTELIQSLARELNKLADEYNGVDTATRSYAVAQEVVSDSLQKGDPAFQSRVKFIAEQIDQITKWNQANKDLKEFQDKVNEAIRQATEGDKSYLRQAQDLIASIEKQGKALTPTEEAWIQINASIADATNLAERLAPSLDAATDAVDKLFEKFRQQSETGDGQSITDALGIPPEIEEQVNTLADAFEHLGQTIAGALGLSTEIGKEMAEVMDSAFTSLSRGIGSLVENYVLLGTTGPAALRKLLAATLAQIAAESAVKAIYYTAQGIADLFFNPAKAAADFTAAALFASIAGASALAGRFAAGDLFSNKPTSTGTGAGANAGARGGPSTQLEPVVANRNVAQPIRVEIVLKDGLHEFISASVVKDWRNNGSIRTTVQADQ